MSPQSTKIHVYALPFYSTHFCQDSVADVHSHKHYWFGKQHEYPQHVLSSPYSGSLNIGAHRKPAKALQNIIQESRRNVPIHNALGGTLHISFLLKYLYMCFMIE